MSAARRVIRELRRQKEASERINEHLADAESVRRIVANIDALLPKWRTWFPNEESEVGIPRRELLLLVEAARKWMESVR